MSTASSPAKRVLTEESRASNIETNTQNDTMSGELNARLRNVGARVRKSVTEGYVTGGSASLSTSPYSSPAKAGSTNYGTPIFRSANDTLRDVYSFPDGFRAPRSSPNKRGRAKSEEPEGHNGTESSDVDMEVTATEADALPSFAIDGGPRPVKPLKRSGRKFAQTRSLPAGLVLSEESRLTAQPQHLDTHTMDEDWSAIAFDSSAKPLRLDIDF